MNLEYPWPIDVTVKKSQRRLRKTVLKIIYTPGPRLVRIPLVRFPLVRIFKKFQNYLAHADSSTGARTSEGIRMREIRD